MARLGQAKRYPNEARRNQQEGVAFVRVTMDRAGAVLSARIERGSGYSALDEETLALVHRAAPLPVPPAEVPGNPIMLTIPVRFSLR